MLRFVLVLLLVLTVLPVSCEELITNGGFETGDTSGWTLFKIGATQPPVTVQTDSVHSGSYAVRVDAGSGREGGLRQTIPTTPGVPVKFSAWCRGDGSGFLFVGFSADGGTNPNSATWTWGFQSPTWVYREMEFTPTGTTATIWLDAWNGVGWFDGFTTEITGSISGTVTDASSSSAVVGATVSTTAGGYSTRAGVDGSYSLSTVDPGTYTLQFRHYAYADVDVPNVAVTANSATVVNAQMTALPRGSITGSVRNAADNTPLQNARVWISGIPGVAETVHQAFTDAGGSYTIPNVPQNTYTVNCQAPGYVEQSDSIAVPGGQAAVRNWQLVWRAVDPANAVQNGDFESAAFAPWTNWCAAHYLGHQDIDDNCLFGDQWIGAIPMVVRTTTGGVGGSAGVEIGLAGESQYAACGGIRQQVYVEPGKHYRVRAQFRGNIPAQMSTDPQNDFEFAVGLVDGRFDPGVYTSPFDPPPFVDDVVKMQCHGDWFGAGFVPEPEMPWHNIMASRSRGNGGDASWDWMSTLDTPAPRNLLVSGVKKATGDTMTVVLYARASYDIWETDPPYAPVTAVFDNVVLEEVPGYPSFRLGDISRLDMSPPFSDYPDLYPSIKVDLSAAESAKVVTGTFVDENGAFMYIQEPDRSAGIRVDQGWSFFPAVGDLVNLTGTLKWTETPEFLPMERVIVADPDSLSKTPGGQVPAPLHMANKMASAKLPFHNPLDQETGPANTGLLVAVWGRVIEAMGPDGYAQQWLRVDDGSGTPVWIRGSLPGFDPNAYLFRMVRAKGVMSITWSLTGTPAMTVLVRDESVSEDFAVLDDPPASP